MHGETIKQPAPLTLNNQQTAEHLIRSDNNLISDSFHKFLQYVDK